jgi:hypothetical protein
MISTLKLLYVAAGAALFTLGMSAWRRAEAARQNTPRAKPEALQRWEDEGGAVPVAANRTAQQVQPHVSGDPEPGAPARGTPEDTLP